METVELAAEIRATKPKSRRHELRRQGHIPAILYGPKTKSTAIAISAVELRSRVSASARQRLMRLKSSSPELNDRHVIVKDIQRAPVSGNFVHADFYEVDLTRPLRVSVPLRFVGKARGVAEGGILQPLVREVDVECLPLEIPDLIEVDVTEIDIHDVIHVSAVKFPDKVKAIFDTDYPVVTVLPPTVAEVAVVAAPEAVEGAPVEGAAPAESAAAAAPAEGAAKEGGDKDKAAKKPEAAEKKK